MPRRVFRAMMLSLGAGLLLWVGLGAPHRAAPHHHSEWLTAGDIRYRALRAGRGDTTLVLLHGYGESLLSWRLILDRFTRRYRILAIDLPGFGLSTRPETGYDYSSYVHRLGILLEQETRGPVVVVGHSMGGQLAAGLALEHPERVVAAVLIAPAGAGISRLLSDSSGVVSPATQWVATALGYVLPVHDSVWLREPSEDLAYEPTEDSASGRAARRVLAEFDFSAIGERYRELKQPVLLIWGRQDPTIPFEIGERIAERLPCRRFVPLLALHRPHQTLPDTVAAEMATFLGHPACGPRP